MPQGRLKNGFNRSKYLIKETFKEWSQDGAPRLAAALAFYTIFAIAPLFVILTSVVGLVYGEEAARGQIVQQISGLIGQREAEAIQSLIQNAARPSVSTWSALGGFLALILAATGVFNELRESMNRIWNVESKSSGVKGMVRSRLVSFVTVLIIGLLLFLSVALSTALTAAQTFFDGVLPGADWIWGVANILVSLVVVTGLFAAIFKLLPETHIEWREVFLGAFITAVLFTVGKTLISLYLGRSSVMSAHGAAGSLVLILMWVYYSTQILFLGAEFTQVHSRSKRRAETQPLSLRDEPSSSAVGQ